MLKKSKGFDSKTISLVSIILFFLMIIIIFISNRYMNLCIKLETKSQENRVILYELGSDLAETSNYLTDEARKFAVTSDITHLYNYWYEVYETKTRDVVIDKLSSYDAPENERVLLSRAKVYSDTLVNTETLSMKLVLLANNISSKEYSYDNELYEYILQVESYEIPNEYKDLTPSEMKEKSIEILYDSLYTQYKDFILSPIDEFQLTLNNRLNNEVAESTKKREFASMLQIVCSIVVLILIAILLISWNVLYVNSINDYANELSKLDKFNHEEFSKLHLTPKGSTELHNFGEVFNRLIFMLNEELQSRINAENEMRISRDKANQVSAERSMFFANMSHEFRTPLNAINGYLYLLNDTSLDSIQRRYCNNIKIASEELLELINNILDFSKIENGNLIFESIDFNLFNLIQDVYNLMENNAIKKGISLRLNIKKDVPMYIKGDTLKLRQVLINLLNNAIKFTSQGEVVLSVNYLGKVEGKNLIEFTVTDTGIGINNENITKIFKPFTQSSKEINRKYGGTGLGLPISQMIVKQFSNNRYGIQVISEVGKGSTFSFKMEFPQGEKCENTQLSDRKLFVKFNNVSVLLVDDNKINLDIEREILQKIGLNVITVDDGFKALETLNNTQFRLIFLDLHMPNLNGYETAKKIRELDTYKDIPIILLTADIFSDTKEKLQSFGINDYISKPFKVDKLYSLIEKYLKNNNSQEPLFDYEECLSNLNGDKFILKDLISRFLEDNSIKIFRMRKYIQIGNYINSRKILHDIIGLSGNLCCIRLYNASIKLHKELKEEISNSFENFLKVWEDTSKILKGYQTIESKDNLNMSFSKKWNEFISLCKNYDTSSVEYFLNNKEYFRQFFEKNEFDSLEVHLKRYDFPWIVKNMSYKK